MGIHAGLDDLQSHLAVHGLSLLGHPDLAHAAGADLLEQLEIADNGGAGAGGIVTSGGRDCSQVAMGDEVPISGYATSGPYVYLFLTGPNLPENGVALHDITKRADQGWFTRVSVDGDDHWSYTWHTGSIGGRLDEGTYTIWVVSGPNDRSRLAEADYRTISVTLGKPFVSVETTV